MVFRLSMTFGIDARSICQLLVAAQISWITQSALSPQVLIVHGTSLASTGFQALFLFCPAMF